MSKSWESIKKSSNKNWKGDKKVNLSSKDFASSSEVSSMCLIWETGFAEHFETDD